MNFPFRIQTHAHISQDFILSLQDSFYQLRKNCSYHNQSPEIMVLHDLCHLIFELVEFHPLYY